jgi:DNA mismatch repair protein MutS
MGGKSTYLRQVALIVVLAQIGSYVPAEHAHIGLVDRLFSRVGAQDDLAGGASTFMVEMVETAAILHQATRQSLVILDEVGRGTSTRDGLAIAQAVVEDLHDRIGARGLFATHFLELTQLAMASESAGGRPLPRLANVHVSALETPTDVVFLHTIQPGPASQAYGIQVARLAGLPAAVADRAADLARDESTAEYRHLADGPLGSDWSTGQPRQLALTGFPQMAEPALAVARALRDLDLTSLTPGQAVDWLMTQQQRLDPIH